MILQPIGDNIVLELEDIEKETKTNSGIVLMTNKTEQNTRKDIATVVSVGEGRTLNNGTVLPCRVKVSDKVLFNKFAGTEIVLEGVKYLLLKDSDILAIVRK